MLAGLALTDALSTSAPRLAPVLEGGLPCLPLSEDMEECETVEAVARAVVVVVSAIRGSARE